jgi:hypothetical protein
MTFKPDHKEDLNHHIRNGILNIHGHIKGIQDQIGRIEKANNAFGSCVCGNKLTEDSTTEDKIKAVCDLLGVNPNWAMAVAKVESAMGKYQKSPTGARGVFQMTSIAMKDLLWAMEKRDDDMIDVCCGVLFLRLLLRRWKTESEATKRYCDPNDMATYVPKVLMLMEQLEKGEA